ncbi:MAG: anthranilate synthase component I [Pseudomonadota bacterium]
MKSQEFASLATQYNRIPVSTEVLADLETPISSYRKLAQGPYSYFLESVHGGEKWGRYSIIGLPCKTVLKVFRHEAQVWIDGAISEREEVEDPLAFAESFRARYRTAPQPGLPVFHGGMVGYFAYDTVRYVEPRLADCAPPDGLGTPDILLMVSEEVLVFDNLAGTIRLVVNADPRCDNAQQLAEQRLAELVKKLRQPMQPLPEVMLEAAGSTELEQQAESDFTQAQYEAAVAQVKEYILAGDVMQVVPSRRMSLPFEAPPLNLYRALRNLNPSPYMYFLDLGDFQIVGSSPEILARVQDGSVTVRPIAGTRRRGHSEAEDLELEKELLADPKEIAEHLMLIDLGRNDVGRIADVGSVVVSDQMVVERYSHVMHIVSNVTGQLKEGSNAIDVLKATLPAGTLSGASKVRAMEIIDELEPVKRGIYGGAVGYISWAGDMDTAIAIRTAVIKEGRLYVQAGGGVVADSVPSLEWKETQNKARAVFRAAAMATGREDMSCC